MSKLDEELDVALKGRRGFSMFSWRRWPIRLWWLPRAGYAGAALGRRFHVQIGWRG